MDRRERVILQTRLNVNRYHSEYLTVHNTYRLFFKQIIENAFNVCDNYIYIIDILLTYVITINK